MSRIEPSTRLGCRCVAGTARSEQPVRRQNRWEGRLAEPGLRISRAGVRDAGGTRLVYRCSNPLPLVSVPFGMVQL